MHRHDYVGTEHEWLAPLAERYGECVAVLDALEVDVSGMIVRIDFVIGKGQSTLATSDAVPLTSRANKVFELSVESARELW